MGLEWVIFSDSPEDFSSVTETTSTGMEAVMVSDDAIALEGNVKLKVDKSVKIKISRHEGLFLSLGGSILGIIGCFLSC